MQNSQKILQRISNIKNKIAGYDSLCSLYDDTMTLIEPVSYTHLDVYKRQCKSDATSL